MTLRELLVDKEGAVCGRWLDAILHEYGALTASRWRQERDRFANPVGHALATGLPALYEAVTGDGAPATEAAAALEEIVRIRSVQGLSPSRAVGFVTMLRDAIREELGPALADGALAAELAATEARIERLSMFAFDTYVRIREQMFRIRQDELKRSVATILRRWHDEEAFAPQPEADLVSLSTPRKGPGGDDE